MLGEDLAQVVLDGVGADEQPGADLRVGQAVSGQPGYEIFLWGQFLTRCGRCTGASDTATCGPQLAASSCGEPGHAHLIEHMTSGP